MTVFSKGSQVTSELKSNSSYRYFIEKESFILFTKYAAQIDSSIYTSWMKLYVCEPIAVA